MTPTIETPNLNETPNKDAIATPNSQSASNQTPNKIEILLQAVGNAPILRNRKFLLERTKTVQYIIGWLKKYMKLDAKDQLFLYVNQEFAPSPDAEIGTIYDCFKIGNTVIFHYCITPAWGWLLVKYDLQISFLFFTSIFTSIQICCSIFSNVWWDSNCFKNQIFFYTYIHINKKLVLIWFCGNFYFIIIFYELNKIVFCEIIEIVLRSIYLH